MASNKSHTAPNNLPYRPCVGLMILNRTGQIWIGRRAGQERLSSAYQNDLPEVGPSWWQMPQGGIDEGETPGQAAFRELFEETGLKAGDVTVMAETAGWHTYDLPRELVGHVWKGRYRGQRQKWFALRFTGEDTAINITPDDPDMIEFDAWRWAELDELMDLIIPFKRDVYRSVLDELGHLARPLD